MKYLPLAVWYRVSPAERRASLLVGLVGPAAEARKHAPVPLERVSGDHGTLHLVPKHSESAPSEGRPLSQSPLNSSPDPKAPQRTRTLM